MGRLGGDVDFLMAAVAAVSLTVASREPGTPLATVSRKVAELETRLGAADLSNGL
jgi:hypothetical protein